MPDDVRQAGKRCPANFRAVVEQMNQVGQERRIGRFAHRGRGRPPHFRIGIVGQPLESRNPFVVSQMSQGRGDLDPQFMIEIAQQSFERPPVIERIEPAERFHGRRDHRRVGIGERNHQHGAVSRGGVRRQIFARSATDLRRRMPERPIGQPDRRFAGVARQKIEDVDPYERVRFAGHQFDEPREGRLRQAARGELRSQRGGSAAALAEIVGVETLDRGQFGSGRRRGIEMHR